MFGNEGERWVQIKPLNLEGITLDRTGEVFVVQEYCSLPHDYVAIKCKDIVCTLTDEVFLNHFIKETEYDYYGVGSKLKLNIGGVLGTYYINVINPCESHITLKLTREINK